MKKSKVSGTFITKCKINNIADNKFSCRDLLILAISKNERFRWDHSSDTCHDFGTALHIRSKVEMYPILPSIEKALNANYDEKEDPQS
jgi:hypothetical protein